MKNKRARFVLVDALLISGMVLPLLLGIILKILLTPPSEGIVIRGAGIYFSIPMPLQDVIITEAQVNSAMVLCVLVCLCLYLTHGIRARVRTRRQTVAEWIVEALERMVAENMGAYFSGFGALVGAILGLSALSSLLALLGLYPPTADLSVTSGWAILVFGLITYYKARAGLGVYVESFGKPLMLAPLNVVGEVATPVSMAFRHYGNVLSGLVISQLVSYGLRRLSSFLFGFLPWGLSQAGWLSVGIPALLSVYFDLFAALLQAYIFAMLTQLYISRGFPQTEYERRQKKKVKKRKIASRA